MVSFPPDSLLLSAISRSVCFRMPPAAALRKQAFQTGKKLRMPVEGDLKVERYNQDSM